MDRQTGIPRYMDVPRASSEQLAEAEKAIELDYRQAIGSRRGRDNSRFAVEFGKPQEFSATRTIGDTDTVAYVDAAKKILKITTDTEGRIFVGDGSPLPEGDEQLAVELEPGQTFNIGISMGVEGEQSAGFKVDSRSYSSSLSGKHSRMTRRHGSLSLSDDGQRLRLESLDPKRPEAAGQDSYLGTKMELVRPKSKAEKLTRKIGRTAAKLALGTAGVVGVQVGAVYGIDMVVDDDVSGDFWESVDDSYEQAFGDKYIVTPEQELPDSAFVNQNIDTYNSIKDNFGIAHERELSEHAQTSLEAINEAESIMQIDAALAEYFGSKGEDSVAVKTVVGEERLSETFYSESGDALGISDDQLDEYAVAAIAAIDVFERVPGSVLSSSGVENIAFVTDPEVQGEDAAGYASHDHEMIVIDISSGDFDKLQLTIAHELSHFLDKNADDSIGLLRGEIRRLMDGHDYNKDDPEAVQHGQRYTDRDYGSSEFGEQFADVMASVIINRYDRGKNDINGVDEQTKRVAAIWFELEYGKGTVEAFSAVDLLE